MKKPLLSLLIFSFFLLVINEDLSSKTYKKKNTHEHNITLGAGLHTIMPEKWDYLSSGLNIVAGYTNNKRALMYSANISATVFSETDSEDIGFKADIYDFSLNASIYWNILEKTFYEGIAPYVGIETGVTFLIEDFESNDGNTSQSSVNNLINFGPVVGISFPLTGKIAFFAEARYKISWANRSTGQDAFGNINTVSIMTDYNYNIINAGIRFGI